MKKNLLIISYAYPPNNVAGAQRPYALAKYLDKEQFNITVLTCENPDLPLGENVSFNPHLADVQLLKIKSLIGGGSSGKLRVKKENRKLSPIGSIKSFAFRIGQKILFPDKSVFWFTNVKKYLKANPSFLENIDLLISSSPGVTNHNIALYIKERNSKVKWIADFRDFNYVGHWQFMKGIKAQLHRKLEQKIISKADNITFVTKSMLNSYQNFYSDFASKMHCFFNGIDFNDYQFETAQTNQDKVISFFYAGTFYKGIRSPLPLLALVDKGLKESLITLEDVSIQIAGIVDQDMLNEMSRYKCFPALQLLGNLPRTEVLNCMAKSSFLWLIVGNIKSHYQTIPIKLFEYMASRRPILNFAPDISECSTIIEELQVGQNFNTLPFDLESAYNEFKKAILLFRNGEYNTPLPLDKLDFFKWEKQIDLIERKLLR